jgi:type IV pilus assembly protein PilV
MKRSTFRAAGRRPHEGMALVECLIAMLIFSIGVVGLMGLEAKAIHLSQDSEDRNRAALLASEIASNMWLNSTINPLTPAYATLLASVNNTAAGGLPNGVVTVTPVAGTTNAADIVITWQPPSDAGGALSTLNTRVILP